MAIRSRSPSGPEFHSSKGLEPRKVPLKLRIWNWRQRPKPYPSRRQASFLRLFFTSPSPPAISINFRINWARVIFPSPVVSPSLEMHEPEKRWKLNSFPQFCTILHTVLFHFAICNGKSKWWKPFVCYVAVLETLIAQCHCHARHRTHSPTRCPWGTGLIMPKYFVSFTWQESLSLSKGH